MSKDLKIGFSCVLALGLVACGSNTTEDVDGAVYNTQPDAAVPTPDGPATVVPDAAVADPYVWVVIQDTEQKACTTNGPGADIDAVAQLDATGNPIAYGKLNTATFIPNPLGNACENLDCKGGNCKYAYIGKTFIPASLVSLTEGPPDATVNATVDDEGYFSLNAGTLQIQMGDITGSGPAKQLKSGDYIQVYEVDQTYITPSNGCVCLPEHYTVSLQTDVTAAHPSTLRLVAATLAPANGSCAALTLTSTEGCGTTVFMVP